ncbi:MAG: hypothetical protein LBJ72_05720 [Dysgonamonadaceae bacterium]|jgi:hypothetical protein|nr:hypothetical protein [Dysgonamonadaceae bacterium]
MDKFMKKPTKKKFINNKTDVLADHSILFIKNKGIINGNNMKLYEDIDSLARIYFLTSIPGILIRYGIIAY